MKKGFTFIEMIVIVVLIAILLSVASLSSANVIEKRSLEEAKNKISLVLRGSAERAYNEGEVYELTINTDNKNLVVTKSVSSTEIVNVELPEMLYYYVSIDDDEDPDSETLYATIDGGYFNKKGSRVNFSVYIFSRNEDVKYRISVVGITASNLAHINIYRNKSSSETLATIGASTIKPSEWEKE